MNSHHQHSQEFTAELLPKLYQHRGRVCAHDLHHEFGVAYMHAKRIMTVLEGRSWVSDPIAHAHGATGWNHPSYIFNKGRVVTDYTDAEAHFRKTATASLVQVYENTVINRGTILEGREDPFAAMIYHGGIALLAAEHDLSARRHWIGDVPGWTSFVDIGLISRQKSSLST